MLEKTIRAKCRQILQADGWTVWIPTKTKYHSNDIFGVFDLVAVRGKVLKWVQYTTRHHIPDRRNKILKFFADNECSIECEIWGYDKDSGTFVIDKLGVV